MMDEVRLEAMLREAAPQVATPISLESHRARILFDARSRARGKAGAWVAAIAALALALGGTSVAAASSGLDTPWGWVADNVFSFYQADSSVCFQGTRIVLHGVPEDSEAARDAQMIVNGIDIASLDTGAAEAWVREQEGIEKLSKGTVHQLAVHRAVAEVLFGELAMHGYNNGDGDRQIGLFSQISACN
ncbi:hypothetical protein [Luethyella okanaganae]|uniref:Uncharacterized protein n=1 Tax=Luethyella okanaganae TaxID=69372 RepID=A0ABW1VCD5_9MICO